LVNDTIFVSQKGFCDQLLSMITFGDRSVNEASIKCQAGLGVLFLVDDIIFYVQKKDFWRWRILENITSVERVRQIRTFIASIMAEITNFNKA